MLLNQKAQTATELAVLGSLVIVAFSFLISYTEKLNRQQAYIQQTFRAALKEARKANNSASYTKVVFRRSANVSNPMELGQLQSYSNSANVLWADGTSKADYGVSKYQMNEDVAIDIPYRDPPPEGATEQSDSSFINVTDATTTLAQTGSSSTKALTVTDTLTADVDVGGKNYKFTHYLGKDGKYYPAGGTVLQRSKDMQ